MIKAVLFDLDGTVIDSTQSDYLAWQRVLKENGIDFSREAYNEITGKKGVDIVKMYLQVDETEAKALTSKQEQYFNVNSAGLQTIPHVEALLDQIRNIPLPMALATGSGKSRLEAIFEKVAIRHYFDVITTADDVDKGKPDPEVFVRAAEKLGVQPAECLVLEDATLGVQAAKACGMQCVAITTTRLREELGEADLVIDTFKDFDIRHWLSSPPTSASKGL